MLDILASTKNKTAAEVAVEIVTDAPKLSSLKVQCAVLAASTGGRARVIVREQSFTLTLFGIRTGRTYRSTPDYLLKPSLVYSRR